MQHFLESACDSYDTEVALMEPGQKERRIDTHQYKMNACTERYSQIEVLAFDNWDRSLKNKDLFQYIIHR